ncbi:MAG: hypothetical protein ACI8Y7_000068 [Candidatus Woesearchaeota archaeon]|jgi:hypothetical protein
MDRTETLQIRLTSYEKQRVLNKMKSDGFSSINTWLRKKLLSDSLTGEKMLIEIHNKVCGGTS